MRGSWTRSIGRLGWRLVLVGAAALACQSIAGVEDVRYEGPGIGDPSTACDEYCNAVLETCTGTLAVYEDLDTCKAVCALLDTESDTSENSNTVACRLRQAKLASMHGVPLVEKGFHCAGAGPGGSTECTARKDAPDCEGYCTIFMAACEADPTAWRFQTVDGCVAYCKAVPPAPEGKYVDTENFGDTLACRLYHASAAALDPGQSQCTNAGLRPSGVCLGQGDPSCEDYCRAVEVACQGELAVYEDRPQCQKVCNFLPTGKRTDAAANTLGCRISHVYNAMLLDEVHCNHVGPVGDGGCKDNDASTSNCSSYCSLAVAACPNQFEVAFDDDAECLSKCSELSDAGDVKYHIQTADDGGNLLQCRLLYAARALATDIDERDDAACAPIFGDAPCE